jgi:hypothetical protein
MLDQMEVIRKPDARIWRYMDLRYFEDMLRTKTLYCARLDRFDDQLEGTRTQRSFDRGMKHWIARYAAEHSMDIELSFPSALNVEDLSRSISRQAVFASCWHKNKRQSSKMWRHYGQDAVAIQSTVGRLLESTKGHEDEYIVHVQSVVYVDHASNDSDEDEAFIYKDSSYSHEREVRAFVMRIGDRGGAQKPSDFPDHLRPPCDLQTLIESVHLPPQSPHFDEVLALLDGAGPSHVPIVI